MDKTIRITSEGAALVDWHLLTPFQGDLKSLTERNFGRLKRSLLEYGFSSPIHVWRCEEKLGEKKVVKLYTLDGHQRCRVLGKLEEEGYEIPKVPVVYVEAKDYHEAKKILLTHASQYGAVEQQGLYELIHQADLSPEAIRDTIAFADFDMDKFHVAYFEKPEKVDVSFTASKKARQPKDDEAETPSTAAHTCPRCGFGFE